MAKPFMIRFPYNGKECFANVYTYNTALREYHVHIIGQEMYNGLPPKIILLTMDHQLHLSDPLDLPKFVLNLVIEGIENHLS